MTVEFFWGRSRQSLVVVGGVCHKTNKQTKRKLKLIEWYDITVFRNTVTLLQVTLVMFLVRATIFFVQIQKGYPSSSWRFRCLKKACVMSSIEKINKKPRWFYCSIIGSLLKDDIVGKSVKLMKRLLARGKKVFWIINTSIPIQMKQWSWEATRTGKLSYHCVRQDGNFTLMRQPNTLVEYWKVTNKDNIAALLHWA